MCCLFYWSCVLSEHQCRVHSLTCTFPLSKHTHWTPAFRLSSSKTTHYSLQQPDKRKKKWCRCSSDTRRPNYVHTGSDVAQHRSKWHRQKAKTLIILFLAVWHSSIHVHSHKAPVLNRRLYRAEDTGRHMHSLSLCLCFPGCWKGFNVRSGWSGTLGRVLGTIPDVLTQKKRAGR